MIAREQLQAQAFVLRLLDYGESDLIITFYCREYGKIKGIAKGARRSRKRFANTLDLFSLSRIYFSRRDPGGLSLIEDSVIINHLGNIRNVLENTLLASYMVELVDHFTIEGKSNPAIYDLLENYLGALNRGFQNRGLIHFFELGLLTASGYEPVLDQCVQCRKPIQPEGNYHFSPQDGGIRCLSCLTPSSASLAISLGTIRSLLYGRNQQLEKLERIIISERSARESRLLLSMMIEHIVGRKTKSYRVLCDVIGFARDA